MSLHDAFHEVQNSAESFQWRYIDDSIELTDVLVHECVEAGLYSLANDDIEDDHNRRAVIVNIANDTADAIERGAIILGSENANPGYLTSGNCIRATGDQLTIELIASHEWLKLALEPEDPRKNIRAIATLLGAASIADFYLAPETYEDHISPLYIPDMKSSDEALREYAKALPGPIASRAGMLERFVQVAGMKAAENEKNEQD